MQSPLAIIKTHAAKSKPVPRVVVSRQIKLIFAEDFAKIRSIHQRQKSDVSNGLIKKMDANSVPSFQASEIHGSDSSQKIDNSSHSQSNFLHEKLNNFMRALSKKASFEEPTIINNPTPKKRLEPGNSDQTPLINEIKNFLQESQYTEADGATRKRIDRKKIQWNPRVYDVYDPEFTSDEEREERAKREATEFSASKTALQKLQKKTLVDDFSDSNNVKSVYFDSQAVTNPKNSQLRNEEKFAVYSTKLSSKPSLGKQSVVTRNTNFVKKNSVYDAVRGVPVVSPYLEGNELSPRKKMTFVVRDNSSKVSIEKYARQTTTITNKHLTGRGSQVVHPETFNPTRFENKSVSRLLELNKSGNGLRPQGSIRMKPAKALESPGYSKLLFGAKRKDVKFI